MITADGCWAEFRIDSDRARGRPCLFLDRDGVLIEDTGYPHRPEDAVFIDAIVGLLGRAHRAGYVTGLVTNQSGIGRGYFDWTAFAALQAHLDAALRRRDAALDFVLACPHHGDAALACYRVADHPWRKPRPGMLLEAASRLGLDRVRSIMVGDRWSDMQAGDAAGLSRLWLLDGTPPESAQTRVEALRRDDLAATFEALAADGGRPGRADVRTTSTGPVRSP